MKTLVRNLVLSAFLAAFWAGPAAALENNQPAPDFTLTDSLGQARTLSEYKSKYVVLEWVNFNCPFVKKHYNSGNMQALQQSFTKDGVVWLSINSSAPGKQGYFSNEEINKRIKDFKAAPTVYLVDADGTVGRMYGAQTTPHIFLISPEGILLYQGAIDSIPGTDVADIPKAVNYLKNAYEAAKRVPGTFKGDR